MISYTITACNEEKELLILLDTLSNYITDDDELIIQLDSERLTDGIKEVVDQYLYTIKNMTIIEFPLNNDFSRFKNNLKKKKKDKQEVTAAPAPATPRNTNTQKGKKKGKGKGKDGSTPRNTPRSTNNNNTTPRGTALTAEEKARTPCMFFAYKMCHAGNDCAFLHDEKNLYKGPAPRVVANGERKDSKVTPKPKVAAGAAVVCAQMAVASGQTTSEQATSHPVQTTCLTERVKEVMRSHAKHS